MVSASLIDPASYRPQKMGRVGSTGAAVDDASFTRAAAWIQRDAHAPEALVLGVPFSDLSLSGARCDLLPTAIRAALWTFSTYSPSLGVDLKDHSVRDVGDVNLSGLGIEESLEKIGLAAESIAGGKPVAVIGGDNSIMAPCFTALCGSGGGLITLDAHHDLRDYKTNGLSNGSPVRVLLDGGLEGRRVWQIGIKDFANSREYSDVAMDAGINVVHLPAVRESGVESVITSALEDLKDGPVYVDVDLDVVDRGLAPGAPAAQPGGLHPSQISYAAFLCGRHPSVVALDIVEVDPERDVAETTVRLACLVLLSFLAGAVTRGR